MNDQNCIQFNKSAVTSYLVVSLVSLVYYFIRLPHIDLPVWDDANIYDYGLQLLKGELGVIDFEWSPLLVFLTAVLQSAFMTKPIVGFFVFQGIGHVILAVGSLCMMLSVNLSYTYATLNTIIWVIVYQSIMDVYPIPVLHLFHFGIPMLVGAYFLRNKPVSIPFSLLFLLLAYLTRNETIVLLLPLWFVGMLRRKQNRLHVIHSLSYKSYLAAFLIITLFVTILFLPQKRPNNRLNIAIAQHYFTYLLKTQPETVVDEEGPEIKARVFEDKFGEEALSCTLIELFYRNYSEMFNYILFNFTLVIDGWVVPGNVLVSYLFVLVYGIGFLFLFYRMIRTWNLVYLLLLLPVVIKLFLTLLIVVCFHYLADILFILIFIIWPLSGLKRVQWLSTGILLLCIILLSPHVVQKHLSPSSRTNLERALFVREANRYVELDQTVVAEYYPPFSRIFALPQIKRCVSLSSIHVSDDKLIAPNGETCDVLLFNHHQNPPYEISKWILGQSPAIHDGEHRLYMADHKDAAIEIQNTQKASPLIITDHHNSHVDLSWQRDYDPETAKTLSLRLDPEVLQVDSNQIESCVFYIQQNSSGRFEYLGLIESFDNLLLNWIRGGKNLHHKFRDGPQFRHIYRFRAVIQLKGKKKPEVIESNGPVEYLPYITVCDHETAIMDLSGGTDQDPSHSRELCIRWNFQDFNIDFNRIGAIHVYVRQNNTGDFKFLGFQDDLTQNHLLWKAGNPCLAKAFKGGPHFGNKYTFRVYVLTKSDSPRIYGPFANSGMIEMQ